MKYFVLPGLFLILLTTCMKENPDIPDTGRKIAINGLITTDTFLNVFVSRSSYLLDRSGASGESMMDFDNLDISFYMDNERIDSLYHYHYYDFDHWLLMNFGNYRSSNVYPLPGREYKIVAKGSGLPEATAITTIPDLVRIERVDTSLIILAPGSYYQLNLGVKFQLEFSDPPNVPNYYLFRMYMNTYWDLYDNAYVPYRSETIEFTCQDPIVEEKLNCIQGMQAVAFSDIVINGQSHNLDVILKAESIREPFMEGPFGSYTTHRKTVYLKLYSITEEYFRYIQTLMLYSKNYSNPLADPVLMYSNVSGGFGMFSGAAVSTDSIVFRF